MFTSTLKGRWWTSLSTLLLAGLAANDLLAQDALLQECPRRSYTVAILVKDKTPPPLKSPSAEDQKKLQALLTERRDVLKEAFEARWKHVKGGVGFVSGDLLDASFLLLQAELELIDKSDDRIGAHEKHVKQMKEMEDITEAQAKNGKIRGDAYKQVQGLRLAAEIDMLREKAGGKPSAEQTVAIKKLLEARRDALREEVESKFGRIKRGLEGLSADFGDASRRLSQAELELTDKPDDRVAVLEKQLALSRDIEKVIKSQGDFGKVRREVVDESKARRLLDEIALLREKAGAKPSAEQTAEIRKLLVERRDALEAVMKAKLARIQAGLETVESFSLDLDAFRFHLQSELELLDKAADRVAAHQKHIERAKKIEEVLKKPYDDGKIRVEIYLQTKAARLEAEIGLLREQMK